MLRADDVMSTRPSENVDVDYSSLVVFLAADDQYGSRAGYAEECLVNEVKIFVELQRDGALSPHVVKMLYYIREPLKNRISHVVMELLPFGSLLALLRAAREGERVS